MRRIASLCDFFPAAPLLCATALAVTAPAGSAAADDDDEQWGPWRSAAWADIEIERVTATGNGCPSGSYYGHLSDNGQQFYLQFYRFRPEVTPNLTSVTSDCRLQISVKVPSGLAFEIQSFSYLGYAYLEQGVTAELATSYYFGDNASSAKKVTSTLKGPFDDIYEIEDKPQPDSNWSPCSKGSSSYQKLNVKLTVSVKNGKPGRDGTLELNEALGMKLGWKKCR